MSSQVVSYPRTILALSYLTSNRVGVEKDQRDETIVFIDKHKLLGAQQMVTNFLTYHFTSHTLYLSFRMPTGVS